MGIWVHPHAHADIPLEVRGGFLVWLSLSDVVRSRLQTPIDCIHNISYVYTVFQHLDDNGNGTMGYDNDDEGNGRQQQRRHGRQTSDRSRQLLSRVLIALGGVCFRVTSSTQYLQNGTIMGDSGTKSVVCAKSAR